ncbi:SRPBCC domain-containing protein [Pedobacter montanisoli]|uniref:SRPBCC domain-containing protein n=1 Tax=Pedobacter montanisoli TaxID=2923277 RepID=A0ABS9ZZI6_9SPHI|nr:SRPBCC domain-containing protein [Pedobacter montanisoli]MCJ0743690.1 SRPBCC domain-containing protein [Pedobacter montanisoli]
MERKELSVTKLLDVPVDLVWKVWTEAEHIANWWGPIGFTNTIQQMDVRVEGEWRLIMHGPDGKNYPNRSIFKEIIPLGKIVFQHFNPNYEATIVFRSKEDKTLIKWTMLFETVELFETVVKVFKADQGLLQNIEKLENYLQRLSS